MDPYRSLPILLRGEVRELDRLAIEEFGLPGVVLMENAGRALSQAVLEELPDLESALILCGRGNNGGDGYVVARCLVDRGVDVTLIETWGTDLTPDAAVFQRVARKLQIPTRQVEPEEPLSGCMEGLNPAQLLIDALLGTGFQGTLRPAAASWLTEFNRVAEEWGSRRVALDVPSGLDVDTGQFAAETFRADLTLTLAADKPAYQLESCRSVVGRVRVLPIGIPEAVYRRLAGSSTPPSRSG